jgi:hypothetical protein
MKQHCRGRETSARYGGDEFAILLLDANEERAQNVAERISSCLRQQTDSPVLSVTIGFSVYPNDGVSAPELLGSRRQAPLPEQEIPPSPRVQGLLATHRVRAHLTWRTRFPDARVSARV